MPEKKQTEKAPKKIVATKSKNIKSKEVKPKTIKATKLDGIEKKETTVAKISATKKSKTKAESTKSAKKTAENLKTEKKEKMAKTDANTKNNVKAEPIKEKEIEKKEEESKSNIKAKKVNDKKTSTKKEVKTVKKQAKKDDEKIKQIISEQLANIENLNQNMENIQEHVAEREKHIKLKKSVKHNKYDPEKIAKEIENKKKLPKEEKIKLRKQAIINLLIACAVTFYGIFLMLGLKNIEPQVFVTDLKFFSVALIILTILIFESSYKKDSGRIALHGVEALIVSIATLVLIYIYILYTNIFMYCVFGFSVVSIVYNIIKSIIIYIRGKKQYKNTISDVKEIIEE